MELLDRYLQAVRFFLPRRQQDDIVRELAANLTGEIDDRAEALDRPLTESEIADILRRHGHPMVVAGRYGSGRHLVGPTLFSPYLLALKVGLGIALLVTVVIGVLEAVFVERPVGHVVGELLAYPGRALMVFAWTTLVFGAGERLMSYVTLKGTWDPRDLPGLVSREERIPRLEAICDLVFALALVVLIVLVPERPFLAMGPGARYVDLAPIWRVVYVPMLVLALASTAAALYNLMRPYRTAARSTARIALNASAFVLVVTILRGRQWVVARGDVLGDAASAEAIARAINLGLQIGLIVTAVMLAVEVVREIYRLKRRTVALPPDSAAAGVR